MEYNWGRLKQETRGSIKIINEQGAQMGQIFNMGNYGGEGERRIKRPGRANGEITLTGK